MHPLDIYLALLLQLAAQLLIFAFFFGRLTQKTSDHEKRLARIEEFIDSLRAGAISVELRPDGQRT